MCIGPVDARSDQEGHAPSPHVFERGGSFMGVCIRHWNSRLKIYKLTQNASLRKLVAAERTATEITNLVFLCMVSCVLRAF